MKIGIIIGSIRDGRRGGNVATWVESIAKERTDVNFELLDLREFNVPLLTAPTPPGAAQRHYDSEEVRRWSAAIDSCDGFIFVTPEYNHSVPGVFKNAVDSLGPEWVRKAVGFVSYGVSGGIRAVEAWRPIAANFQMYDIRPQVELNNFAEFDAEGNVTPADRKPGEVRALVDALVEATAMMTSFRTQ